MNYILGSISSTHVSFKSLPGLHWSIVYILRHLIGHTITSFSDLRNSPCRNSYERSTIGSRIRRRCKVTTPLRHRKSYLRYSIYDAYQKQTPGVCKAPVPSDWVGFANVCGGRNADIRKPTLYIPKTSPNISRRFAKMTRTFIEFSERSQTIANPSQDPEMFSNMLENI